MPSINTTLLLMAYYSQSLQAIETLLFFGQGELQTPTGTIELQPGSYLISRFNPARYTGEIISFSQAPDSTNPSKIEPDPEPFMTKYKIGFQNVK